MCSPNFIISANIVTVDEDKFLEIDTNSLIVNTSILPKFNVSERNLSKDMFINEITDIIINNPKNLIYLKTKVNKYFNNVISDELLMYPSIWPLNEIRKYLSKVTFEDNEFQIIPAAGTVLIEKSESTLKVINDLNEMAQLNVINESLKNLLSGNENFTKFNFSFYQSRLNIEQYNSLKNANQYSNSLIIGPPGTGKTYTITSIISDAVINNKSVLVVSKTKHTVEVLRSMLQDDFELENYLIHTSGNKYKLSLKSRIRKYLSGISAQTNINLNEPEIRNLFERLWKLEEKFRDYIDVELNLSDLEFKGDLNLIEKFKKLYFNTTPAKIKLK